MKKKANELPERLNKFWHPIYIYNTLKTWYFSIIPKGSKAYDFTYSFLRVILKQFQIFNIYYREWIRRIDTFTASDLESFKDRSNAFVNKPHISVIMPVYNPPIAFLQQAIESVLQQVYPYWELCIADDASTNPQIAQLLQDYALSDDRIRFIIRDENGHISAASNSALSLASHEFIALLDHDDLLHPLALYYVAQAINEHPDCEIIYTDEDKITKRGRRLDPYFKPEFDYELILSHNMVSHLGVYRLSTVRNVGGFRKGLEGSQDYDLFLRVLEKSRPEQIVHIPFPLYHWRISSQSAAENVNIKPYAINAAQRALSEHHARMNVSANVTFLPEFTAFQTNYIIQDPQPQVEIIFLRYNPAKTQPDYLETLIESAGLENIQMKFGSTEKAELENDFFESGPKELSKLQVHSVEAEAGLASTLNELVSCSTADYLIIFTDLLSGFPPGWLSALIGQTIQTGVGAVAPKLFYSTGNIYYNGIILRQDPLFNYLYNTCSKSENGYFGWAMIQRGYSTLTEKCFAIKRDYFLEVNGLDQIFDDPFISFMDFFLKLKDLGLRNVLLPSVQLYLPTHYISKHNGLKDSFPEEDLLVFKRRWEKYLINDPSFNPNLDIFTENRIIVNTSPQLFLPGD